MRKIVLALFLTLSGGLAAADTSAGDKKPTGGKAQDAKKTGNACKADSDCAQTGGRARQRCLDGKCETVIVHPVT